MISGTLAAPCPRGSQDEIGRAHGDGQAITVFVRSRLYAGLLGALAVAPYLALRPAIGPPDALLAFGLAAPLAAATVASRAGRLDVAYGVASAGNGALVGCVFLAAGAFGWPALLFLLAAPLEARSAGAVGSARVAGLVSAAFTLVLLGFGEWGRASLAGASLAAGVLIAGLLIDPALRRFAPGSTRTMSEDADGAEEPVLATLCDLVTWHDGGGDVIRAAGAADRISGLPASALLGNGLFRRIHIPDRPAYLKALSDAANGREPVMVDLRLLVDDVETGKPGARLTWTEMRAHGVRGRTVAVIRDASEAHRHAEELEAARREAEQASEMKGRFLGTVSHELRTPLNAIIGFSELLAADHPYAISDERRKEYAVIIRDSGHHLLDVVNTLLDISKIESGNFAVTPEPFGIADLAQGCCDLMQLKADQAGVTLVRRIPDDLPDLTGDRRACRQILINLLSNAVKFTPAGGSVSVEVSRDGERLHLAIADEGIGIREADLPRLGDPFFQAGDLHRRPHEGTGLGLSVVRGLVGLHRGSLAIESGPGLGTTVTVCLPLEGRPAPESAKPVPVRTAARRATPLFERISA